MPLKIYLSSALIFIMLLYDDFKFSMPFLIVLGMCDDALNAQYIGGTALMYLSIYALVKTNGEALRHQNFNIVWLSFIGTLIVGLLVKLIGDLIFTNSGYSYFIILELLATILCYPYLHYILLKKISLRSRNYA